jgi:hypothetical protein
MDKVPVVEQRSEHRTGDRRTFEVERLHEVVLLLTDDLEPQIAVLAVHGEAAQLLREVRLLVDVGRHAVSRGGTQRGDVSEAVEHEQRERAHLLERHLIDLAEHVLPQRAQAAGELAVVDNLLGKLAPRVRALDDRELVGSHLQQLRLAKRRKHAVELRQPALGAAELVGERIADAQTQAHQRLLARGSPRDHADKHTERLDSLAERLVLAQPSRPLVRRREIGQRLEQLVRAVVLHGRQRRRHMHAALQLACRLVAEQRDRMLDRIQLRLLGLVLRRCARALLPLQPDLGAVDELLAHVLVAEPLDEREAVHRRLVGRVLEAVVMSAAIIPGVVEATVGAKVVDAAAKASAAAASRLSAGETVTVLGQQGLVILGGHAVRARVVVEVV